MGPKILFCWLGMTDLKAASGTTDVGLGPVAQAVEARSYSEVVLLNNWDKIAVENYPVWLKEKTSSPIILWHFELSSPTHFGEIYQAASEVISKKIKEYGTDTNLVYHLSPGTPAMAAVWILLAKTRFPAELIESSREQGVRTVDVPFDISAEFIPDLLRGPDKRLEQLSAGLPPDAPEFESIIHRTQVMRRVITKARYVALRSVPVLIEGESGTGKELLARAIHRASPRKNEPFVAINCGAIPAELVEAELFGHEKGAFTGAGTLRHGYFETADKGTLFLDEIGELPVVAQVKLLRAIQEKELYRVGSTQAIKFDVRLIAATNRNLIDEVAEGRFRSDLFYRIAVAVLKLPPMRERKGDMGILIDSLLENINAESENEPGYKQKKLSANAKNVMIDHVWPGNVRELQNTLSRAAIWTAGSTIGVEDIREAMLPMAKSGDADLLQRPFVEGFSILKLIEKLAKHYLRRALNESGGNKTKAAGLLGFANYQTFSNWMKKYDVK